MAGFIPRAPRLPLRAPVALKSAAAAEWVEGQTLNISRSGVLFRLPASIEIRDDLEFVINLSKGAMHGPGVALLPDLHCQARIVRLDSGPDGARVVAASIRRQTIRSHTTAAAGSKKVSVFKI